LQEELPTSQLENKVKALRGVLLGHILLYQYYLRNNAICLPNLGCAPVTLILSSGLFKQMRGGSMSHCFSKWPLLAFICVVRFTSGPDPGAGLAKFFMEEEVV